MNGKRPVGTKGKSIEEQRLAREWGALLKKRLTLPVEHLADADDLLAQFDTGVDELVAWMTEHKRSPKRNRAVGEDKLARKWSRCLSRPPQLPQKLRAIHDLMSNYLAWVEAEAADVALHAQCTADIDLLVAWMDEHKRCPKRDRGDLESKLAEQWG